MNKIKLVVFDMAGTTVQDNKEVESCLSQACVKTDLIASEEKLLALQGYSKIEVFKILWDEQISNSHPEFENNVQGSYNVFKGILETHYREVDVYPTTGCLETFGFLKDNGIKIGLTTGFYRKVTNIILDKLGWMKGLNTDYMSIMPNSIIDVSITSDEVDYGRPATDMIVSAMRMLNIQENSSVINIGDTPSDLVSGVNSGVRRAYGLINGTHTFEQLLPFANDGLLPRIDALIPVIKKLNSIQ